MSGLASSPGHDTNGLSELSVTGSGASNEPTLGQAGPPPVAVFSPSHISALELAAGFIGLVLWFTIFGGGILVSTERYRQSLANASGLWQTLRSGVVVFAFWTITNVGLLSCVSAFLGAFGRRTRFAIQLNEQNDTFVDLIPRHVSSHYASAVIRGFGIYTMMMAGLLVLATETFEKPTQGGYLRLAATASLIAFYAGFDPELFASVLQRVKRLLDAESAVRGDPGSTQKAAHPSIPLYLKASKKAHSKWPKVK